MKVLKLLVLLICGMVVFSCNSDSHNHGTYFPIPLPTPAAVLSVDNATVVIKNIAINSTKSETLVVSNSGTGELTGLTIGSLSGEFSRTTTCTETLTAGANCNVIITFAPTTAGLKAGTLVISSKADNKSVAVMGYDSPIIFTDIYTEKSHTFAKDSYGKLYAWGNNGFSLLGVGDKESRSTPTLVRMPAGVTSFTDVYAGQNHTLASDNNGKLYAWGWNLNGQLGVNDEINRNVPTSVSMPNGVTSFTDILLGFSHTFAKGNDGKLYAWGLNRDGQLSVGDYIDKNIPTLVKIPDGVTFTDIYAGGSHAIAKDSNGKLYAWGENISGQLGVGDNAHKNIPALVKMPAGVTSFTDVYIGYIHTTAKGSDGKLYSWGRNSYGQLGVGDGLSKNVPTLVTMPAGVTSFTDVFVGTYHTIAKGSDGNWYAWGENDNGKLGVGDNAHKNIPTPVIMPAGVTSFTDVYAGQYHSTAKDGGKLYAWGNNSYGELNVGDKVNKNIPTLVKMPEGVTSFTNTYFGFSHTFAKDSTNKLYAWGVNQRGELGVGNFDANSTSTLVFGQE